MPFYPDDKVRVSILPTDRSERDERTGIVTVIGFSPIRGQGLVKHGGFGYSRVEGVGKVQAIGGEPEAKFLKQVAQGTSEWDYIRWDDIAEKPLQFPPEPHKHGLEDLLQSGAITGQVIKFDGTNWSPSWVNWDEIDGRPSQFPPAPHTHSRSDITDFSHASTHASGGNDPIIGNLDANARVTVKHNGTIVGTRRAVNFIAGSNVSLGIIDDAENEEIDITISAAGGGGGNGGSSSHNLLDGIVHPDTEPTAVQQGMLVVGKLSGSVVKWGGLALGAAGKFLKSDGTDAVWSVIDWTDIQNRPSTFPPSPHTHVKSDITDFAHTHTPSDISPQGSGSGLDADTVDGQHASAFAPVTHTHNASDITSGRLSTSRLPTSSNANRFLVVRTSNSDPVYDVIQASDLPSHTHTPSQISPQGSGSGLDADTVDGQHASAFAPASHTHTRSQITDFAHASTHVAGGSDPITGNLDANARVTVKQSGTVVGTRRAINFIAGSNISLSISDDAANEEVDVTISAAGGGSSSHNLLDGVVHPDTESTTVQRGMLVVGKLSGAVVKWGGLPLGAAGRFLKSNGTDAVWDVIQASDLPTHTHTPSQISPQGSGSGLDADTVDGQHASAFAPATHTHSASDITSGRLSASRLPTSPNANRFLVVRTANSDPIYDTIQASDLPSHTHTRSQITDFAHASTHASGGSDPITGNLDANARVGVMNAGTLVGTRRRINFIAGTNVTLNIVDDATNEKVDVTINSQSVQGELFVSATAPPQVIGAGSYFVLSRITVPTQKPNLKVIAVAVSPFYGYGGPANAQIILFNETDGVAVATWGSGAGPVYFEPNQSFNLGGKTVSFRLSHGAPGSQECWGSVSFKLTT
jgi:hypothetical protein